MSCIGNPLYRSEFLIVLDVILLSTISLFISTLYDAFKGQEPTTPQFFPIMSGYILSFLFISYLLGHLKMVKTIQYSYLCRYNGSEVAIYNFKIFSFKREFVSHFSGSDRSIERIKSMIDDFHESQT